MPALPNFNVSDTTAQRLLAAFDGQTEMDGTPIPAAQAYKRWLKTQIVNYVRFMESQKGESLEDAFPL